MTTMTIRTDPSLKKKTDSLEKLKWTGARILFGIFLVLFWQVGYSLGLVDPVIARSPEEVGSFLWEIIIDGTLWPALWSTMSATLIAFVLASTVGVILGIALGLFPRVEMVVDPFLNAANAMPRIAFAPLFVIWFGIGQTAKVALAFTIVVFILLLNARAGIRTVQPDVKTMATMMGMNKLQMFWKILLPTAVPSIFAGLRLGLIYSLLGVITSEIVAARQGLGQLIASYAGTFVIEGVYAIVIVLAIIAAVLNMLMAMVERKILKRQGVES